MKKKNGLRTRKPRKPTRAGMIKRLDKVFSLVIRKRDGVCQWCDGNGKLDTSHCKDRRYYGTRWDMVNAIALCPNCHRFSPMSWHNDPEAAWEWFRKKFPARAEYLSTLTREGKLLRKWTIEEMLDHENFLGTKLSEIDS